MNQECQTGLLSDYIDDELEPVARQQVEEHIAACPSCRAVVAELHNVVRRAGALDHPGPGRDLWPAIAARIGAAPSTRQRRRKAITVRRITMTVPQLLAAGMAMIVVGAAAGWIGFRSVGNETVVAASPAEAPTGVQSLAPVSFETRYDRAVSELMATLEREREWLSPSTIRVVEANLRVINAAIARAQEALAQDPESDYVRDHLDATVRKKLGLLQRVTELASRS